MNHHRAYGNAYDRSAMSGVTVGIIGGSGWVGSSIARSLLKHSFLSSEELILSGRTRNPALADWPAVRVASSNQDLVDAADLILVSVRPEQFPSVHVSAREKLLISVMAAVPARVIAARTGSHRIVRAMPNAAVEIERSYTPWFALPDTSSSDRRLVQNLFESCGTAEEVSRESDIDYLTGLSGMGPALPALLAKAMLEHARSRGLSADTARRAVEGVVVGASALMSSPNRSADKLIEILMSYRGTTAAALEEMIACGFVTAVQKGLTAAESAIGRMMEQGGVSG